MFRTMYQVVKETHPVTHTNLGSNQPILECIDIGGYTYSERKAVNLAIRLQAGDITNKYVVKRVQVAR